MARTPTTEELLREFERIQQMGPPSARSFKYLDQHRRDLGYGPPLENLRQKPKDPYAEVRRKMELLNQRERPITLEDFPELQPKPFVSSINRAPRFSNIQENLGSLEAKHGIKKIAPPNGLGSGPADRSYRGKSVEQIVAEGAQPEGQTFISGPRSQPLTDTEQLTQRDAPNRLPSGHTRQPSQIQEETFRTAQPPTVLSGIPSSQVEETQMRTDPRIKQPPQQQGMLEGLLSGVRGITDPIFSGAKNLFEDPRRMALLMGGLKMMDPNSQYTVDKAGNEWYSPWSAPVAGLGAGIQTYRTLSEPRKIGFKAQEEIKRKNALELEKQKQTGRMELEAEKLRATGGKTAKDKNGRLRWVTGTNAGGLVYPEVTVDPESMNQKQIVDTELKLSGEFNKSTKIPQGQVDAYRRIEAIFEDPMVDDPRATNSMVGDGGWNGEQPSEATTQLRGFKTADGDFFELSQGGAADLALIFNFMKMLDPQSVVRESEFALAETTGGMSESIKAQWQKLLTGGRLSKEMRKNIMRQARSQYNSAEREMKKQYKAYTKRAERYKDMGIQSERALYYEPYEPLIETEAFRAYSTHPETGKVIDPDDPYGILKKGEK